MPLDPKLQKQFNTVCARIAEGESLVAICKDKAMPSYATVGRWLLRDGEGELRATYAQARAIQADFYADQIIAIADKESDPSKARNRIDSRKWLAGKLKPRVYGDKIALGGADDLPAIRQEVQERADAFVSELAGMAKRAEDETRH